MSNPMSDELTGGLGGSVAVVDESPGLQVDDRTPGRDLKLIQQAVRKGWIIRDDAMEELPEAMLAIALDDNRDDRARISAAKVLTTMYAQANPATGGGTTVNVGVQVNANQDLYD